MRPKRPFLRPLAIVPVVGSALLTGVQPHLLFAQTISSSVSGTVTDSTGAVVPNAKITVRNEGTGQQFSATTDGGGGYTITNISPGSYTVNAQAQGFQTQSSTHTQVDANIGRQVNFALKTGEADTTITVEANANALQTESATVGQLVTSEQVKSIQLNGRNPIYLSQLEPGVTRGAPLSSFNFAPDFGGPQISGARNDEIAITFDSAPMIRTRGNGTTTGVPDVDTIQQMQILSTTYAAQYGGSSGGVLVQVPRTGTKDFHGSAYEYLRNSFFNANTWIRKNSGDPTQDAHPPAFRFNQFGWNLNGPIAIPGVWEGLRTKLFFLVGQEYLRYRQTPTQTGKVPTALMRQGNFSELLGQNIFYPSGTVIRDPKTGQPYQNNIIPAGELSAQGLALLNAYPAANANGGTFNWIESRPYPQNQRKDTITLDYLPSAAHQFRFSLLHYIFNQNSPFSGNFDRTPQVWNWPNEVGVLHYIWTISPTLINDFTASGSSDHVTITTDLSSGLYDRTRYGINFPYLFPAADKLIPNKIPTINLPNFGTLDGGPYPSHSGGEVIVFGDQLTKVLGRHTLIAGGQYVYSGENNFDQINVSNSTPGSTNNQNGQFIFSDLHNKQPTTGVGIANAALGQFDSYGEIGQKSYTLFRANAGEIFLQDTWRATPHMVIEAGVRYSMFQPYYALWGNQSFFNPANYVQGASPTVNPTTGVTTGGDPYNGVVIPGNGFPSAAQGHLPASVLSGQYDRLFHGYDKAYSPIVWTNVQPRVGITDQLSPTTVVRLGGGRFVQRLGISDTIQVGGNPPFQPAASVTNGLVDNPGGTSAASYPLQLSSQAYHFPSPESWAWSASLEQDFPRFATLTLSYVGRRGIHLQQLTNLNQMAPGTIQPGSTINPDALRPYQGFGSILEQSNAGSSTYNGLQVNLKRRLTKNVLFGAAYTWAKLLDYGSSKGYVLPNRFTPGTEYGPADFDIRNVLVVDYVWNLAYADHASNLFARSILGNWQVSGVTQAQGGTPFSIQTGNDYAGVGPGAGSQRWYITKQINLPRQWGPGTYFFDTSAFQQPTAGTFAGRGTRNQIYNPGFQSWNIALVKAIHLVPSHENQQLLFRAEAFNFTNHPNWDDPDSNPTSGTFGQTLTKGQTYSSDRQLQFSLRYQF